MYEEVDFVFIDPGSGSSFCTGLGIWQPHCFFRKRRAILFIPQWREEERKAYVESEG